MIMEGMYYAAIYSHTITVKESGVLKDSMACLLGLFSSQDKAEKYIMDYFHQDIAQVPYLTIVKTKKQLERAVVLDSNELVSDDDVFVKTMKLEIKPCNKIDSVQGCIGDIYQANCNHYIDD